MRAEPSGRATSLGHSIHCLALQDYLAFHLAQPSLGKLPDSFVLISSALATGLMGLFMPLRNSQSAEARSIKPTGAEGFWWGA